MTAEPMEMPSATSPRSRARVGAIALVTAALFLAFRALEWYTAGADDAAFSLQASATDLQKLSALEWEVVARGGVAPEDAAEMARLFERLEQSLPGGVGAAGRLQDDLAAYKKGVQAEFAAVLAGDIEGAKAIDEAQVDPAFEVLDADIRTVIAERQADVERAAVVELVGSFVAIAGAALVIVLTLERLDRSRAESGASRARAESLARGRRMLDAITASTSDLMLVVGVDQRITFAGGPTEALLGHTREALLGKPLIDLIVESDRAAVAAALLGVVTSRSTEGRVSAAFLRAGADPLHTEIAIGNALANSELSGLVLTVRDQSARLQMERALEHKAFHDDLTGLANRAAFLAQLRARLGNDSTEVEFGLLVLDLDGFKEVNDALGHPAGDALLTLVAQRLVFAVRSNEFIARLGGDEFGLILPNVRSEEDLATVATHIHRALSAPFPVLGQQVGVAASIGGALGGVRAGESKEHAADTLVSNADLAMYEAKRKGRNCYVGYSRDISSDGITRLGLRDELRRAIAAGEIFLEYQPIVDLRTRRICGAEALARWTHPRRGAIPPAEFIPLAEASGLITDLGRLVLRQACVEAAQWPLGADEPAHVAVNVSGLQFQRPDFLETVVEALRATGLDPRRLVLEITEQSLIQEVRVASDHVRGLRELGIRFALDDFGTGYSSLSYLRSFPIDWLKIDRSFVEGLPSDAQDAALVAAIIALAGSLGIEVVAEGIETAAQQAHLERLRCSFAQGFLFSRPVDPKAFRALLVSPPRSGA